MLRALCFFPPPSPTLSNWSTSDSEFGSFSTSCSFVHFLLSSFRFFGFVTVFFCFCFYFYFLFFKWIESRILIISFASVGLEGGGIPHLVDLSWFCSMSRMGSPMRSIVAIGYLVSTSALVFFTSAGGLPAANVLVSSQHLLHQQHQHHQQQQQQQQQDARSRRRSLLHQRDSSCSLESAASTLSSNGT